MSAQCIAAGARRGLPHPRSCGPHPSRPNALRLEGHREIVHLASGMLAMPRSLRPAIDAESTHYSDRRMIECRPCGTGLRTIEGCFMDLLYPSGASAVRPLLPQTHPELAQLRARIRRRAAWRDKLIWGGLMGFLIVATVYGVALVL